MLQPQVFDEMSVIQCLEAERSMLYPWEVDEWERGTLSLDHRDLRRWLMLGLEERVCELEAIGVPLEYE